MSSTMAVVLAGGKGKRMDILCQTRPKPALTFAGKYRVIDFSLSNCVHSGIADIAVLTDYKRSHLADYLRGWHLMNATQLNFRILEPKNGSYQGTADAVYQNLDYLDERMTDTVLVLAADHIYKLDYRKMIDFHQQRKADVTLAVIPVPVEQADRFGTVLLDSNNRVTEFLEKSPASRSNLASMGIYVFNKTFLARRLTADAGDPASWHDFGFSILPKAVRTDRVFAYRFNGYWQDIGTIEAYYQANLELTREKPGFSLNSATPVLTREQNLPPPYIGKQAVIKNSLLSPGCVIEGIVENSILSPGVRIAERAEVTNSVIMDRTVIGYHSIVENCVLDEKVNIGEYCYIGFGSSPGQARSGITILGSGVIVPSRTAIGRSCVISPHVEPSDFAGSTVSHGSNISKRIAVDSVR